MLTFHGMSQHTKIFYRPRVLVGLATVVVVSECELLVLVVVSC